jgi:hypothetical protein
MRVEDSISSLQASTAQSVVLNTEHNLDSYNITQDITCEAETFYILLKWYRIPHTHYLHHLRMKKFVRLCFMWEIECNKACRMYYTACAVVEFEAEFRSGTHS